jgi:hypothetical protein
MSQKDSYCGLQRNTAAGFLAAAFAAISILIVDRVISKRALFLPNTHPLRHRIDNFSYLLAFGDVLVPFSLGKLDRHLRRFVPAVAPMLARRPANRNRATFHNTAPVSRSSTGAQPGSFYRLCDKVTTSAWVVIKTCQDEQIPPSIIRPTGSAPP